MAALPPMALLHGDDAVRAWLAALADPMTTV
jgi:hypothetical protein